MSLVRIIVDLRGEELARQVEAAPDDVDIRRAYGDWLEERGDPRSQLMAMQLLRERVTDRTKLEHLDARIEAFFEQHRDHFLGALTKITPKATASKKTRDKATQRFTWKAGFIHTARIGRDTKLELEDILAALLLHPSGRFLVQLEVDHPRDCARFFDILVEHVPQSLRSLILGANEGDLSALWPRVPQLRQLVLGLGEGPGDLELPELREARFKQLRSVTALKAIEQARMPALEVLEVEGFQVDEGLLPILEREDLPHVRELAIGTGHLINELLPQFVKTPLARQLTTLDLCQSYMLDDTGARALEALRLEELRLHPRGSQLSPAGKASLALSAKSIVHVEPNRFVP